MTREEFYEKYGDVEVKFDSYYKYTFSYRGITPDGNVITCEYGGNIDDIYRHDVSRDGVETVRNLYPYAGNVYVNGNGIEIESFYDFQ